MLMLDGAAAAGAVDGPASPVGTVAAPAGAAKAVSQRAMTATTVNAERPRERVEVWNATIPCRCARVWACTRFWARLGPAEHRRLWNGDKWYWRPVGGYPVAPADDGGFPIGDNLHHGIRESS
jgi:hypothetical protein